MSLMTMASPICQHYCTYEGILLRIKSRKDTKNFHPIDTHYVISFFNKAIKGKTDFSMREFLRYDWRDL